MARRRSGRRAPSHTWVLGLFRLRYPRCLALSMRIAVRSRVQRRAEPVTRAGKGSRLCLFHVGVCRWEFQRQHHANTRTLFGTGAIAGSGRWSRWVPAHPTTTRTTLRLVGITDPRAAEAWVDADDSHIASIVRGSIRRPLSALPSPASAPGAHCTAGSRPVSSRWAAGTAGRCTWPKARGR